MDVIKIALFDSSCQWEQNHALHFKKLMEGTAFENLKKGGGKKHNVTKKNTNKSSKRSFKKSFKKSHNKTLRNLHNLISKLYS